MTEHNATFTLVLNGNKRSAPGPAGMLLVDLLREGFRQVDTNIGCRNGDCGSCTVLVDGRAIKSCLLPAERADGREVTTLGGLANSGRLSAIQESFWRHNGFQCGYCLAGHILCLAELQARAPRADRSEIVEALRGNLCRCTGYQQIVEAALHAFASDPLLDQIQSVDEVA